MDEAGELEWPLLGAHGMHPARVRWADLLHSSRELIARAVALELEDKRISAR